MKKATILGGILAFLLFMPYRTFADEYSECIHECFDSYMEKIIISLDIEDNPSPGDDADLAEQSILAAFEDYYDCLLECDINSPPINTIRRMVLFPIKSICPMG